MLPDESSAVRVNDDIRLIQKKGGHTFGTDALLLAAFTAGAPAGTALELGAGTGIISLLCAVRGRFEHIDALELQPEMAEIASANVAINAMEDKIDVHCADLRGWQGRCRSVFTNPPYIKIDCGHHNPEQTRNASRRELNGGIADFCACAGRCLTPGGAFYCVWRAERLCDLLQSMREAGIEPKRLINVFPDEGHKPCLVLCEGRRGGGQGSLFVTPPFILNRDGRATPDCDYVYERGEFPERYRKP